MFSKYSLLFTKKSVIILYTLGALFGLVVLIGSAIQVIGAYRSGEGFDVTAETFYYAEIILYLPFFIVNGYLLRLLIERWRIYQRGKKMFHIAEYEAPDGFSPAHAGLLIDNDMRIEETVATLYDLDRRGVLAMTDSEISLQMTNSPVTPTEKRLIDALFSRGSTFNFNGSNSTLFLEAADEFRKAVLAEMRHSHMLPMPRVNAITKALLGIIFTVFSYVSIVLATYLIFDPDLILQIQYPRYDMEIGQPILVVIVAVLVLLIALSGFATSLLAKEGPLNWRLAAGYRLYVKTVFKGKFDYANPSLNSVEQQKVLPYAIAFGIEKRPVRDFVRKLGL